MHTVTGRMVRLEGEVARGVRETGAEAGKLERGDSAPYGAMRPGGLARLEEPARVAVVTTMLAAPALAALAARWDAAFLSRTATFSVLIWIVAVSTLVISGWADVVADFADACSRAETESRLHGGEH